MIGTGYVGLVSGTCFAEMGHDVVCVDIDPEKIAMLKDGKSPIYEPGLTELLVRNIENSRLSFSTDYDSVGSAQVVFLAVGTPSAENGDANLDYLFSATESVAPLLQDNSIVVIKSTVPVCTHQKIKEIVKQKTNKTIHIVNNPEFLKEGSAVDDFMRPDRVVIGRHNKVAGEVMEKLYAPLVRQGNPIYLMSNISAEMTKYAANSFLATRISFINEIARLCDRTGADIGEVRQGISSDRRIGKHFLYPGPGYGGSCFPKDVKALISTAKEFGMDLKLAQAAEDVNVEQKLVMFHKMNDHFKGDLKGKKFAFWGVAFKANTDDIRETAAIGMAKELTAAGAQVRFYDPVAHANYKRYMDHLNIEVEQIDNKYDCLNDCDGLVVLTEWAEFRVPDFYEIKKRLKDQVIFDARNLFKTEEVLDFGFAYHAIGKKI